MSAARKVTRLTMAEARRRVARGAAAILSDAGENRWLLDDEQGHELSASDQALMRAAYAGLVAMLQRRGQR